MVAKRAMDLFFSVLGIVLLSPIILLAAFIVFLYDRHFPFYTSYRIGKDGIPFKLFKLRTMWVGADKMGIDSTSDSDIRIIPPGKWLRKYKIDEFPQLLNVLRGEMSLVGPRPNVPRQVATYNKSEQELLTVLPGITDIASIFFSNEGEILKNSISPDLDYDQWIRPTKSQLGLLYLKKRTLTLDLFLCGLTLLNIANRAFTFYLLRLVFPELISLRRSLI